MAHSIHSSEDQHLDAVADVLSQHLNHEMLAQPAVRDALMSYAAWLEGEKNPRGTALKLFLTMHSMEDLPNKSSEMQSYRKSLQELLQAHMEEWDGGLNALSHNHFGLPGLPLTAEFSLDEQKPDDVIALIRDQGRSLITVSLLGGQGSDVIRILEQTPHLRSVNIEHCPLGSQAVEIAELPTAGKLRQVALQKTNIDAAALEALLQNGNLSHLLWFDVSYNVIGPDGAHALKHLPLTQIQQLLLAACGIEDKGVGDLLLNVRARAMHILGLGGNELSGKGMHTLGTGDYPQMHRLILGANDLGSEGAEQLARITSMPELRSLFLALCKLSADDAINILSSQIGNKLAYMDLQANPINDKKLLKAAAKLGKSIMPMQGFTMDPESAESFAASSEKLVVNLNNLKPLSR